MVALLSGLYIVALSLTFGGGLVAGAGLALKSPDDAWMGVLTAAAGVLFTGILTTFLFSTIEWAGTLYAGKEDIPS